jgi:hypothetical protein
MTNGIRIDKTILLQSFNNNYWLSRKWYVEILADRMDSKIATTILCTTPYICPGNKFWTGVKKTFTGMDFI